MHENGSWGSAFIGVEGRDLGFHRLLVNLKHKQSFKSWEEVGSIRGKY